MTGNHVAASQLHVEHQCVEETGAPEAPISIYKVIGMLPSQITSQLAAHDLVYTAARGVGFLVDQEVKQALAIAGMANPRATTLTEALALIGLALLCAAAGPAAAQNCGCQDGYCCSKYGY